jgi:hypothetical protein
MPFSMTYFSEFSLHYHALSNLIQSLVHNFPLVTEHAPHDTVQPGLVDVLFPATVARTGVHKVAQS